MTECRNDQNYLKQIKRNTSATPLKNSLLAQKVI